MEQHRPGARQAAAPVQQQMEPRSVPSTALVLETRQETSVRDERGAEILWQYTRGTLLT